MNGALRSKRPALPPTPQQIHDANYDIRYIAEPDRKRAKFLNRNPVFCFSEPEQPKVFVGSANALPTNEPIDLSTMI